MGERSVEPDRTARALFDYENATIRQPLADYSLSDEDWHVINTANAALYESCMSRRGLRYFTIGPFVHDEDRTYGLWHVERARQFGFRLASDPPVGQAADDESQVEDPGWQEGFALCQQEVSEVRSTFFPPDDVTQGSVVSRIAQRSYILASEHPDWKTARERWWACLEAKGLEADRTDGHWGSTQPRVLFDQYGPNPADSRIAEEMVRIATVEATCNEETGMARTLADLEAAYQVALIRGEEAALVAEKEASRQYLDAARAYIAANQ